MDPLLTLTTTPSQPYKTADFSVFKLFFLHKMPCSEFPWVQHGFLCLFRKTDGLVCDSPAVAGLIAVFMVGLAPRWPP